MANPLRRALTNFGALAGALAMLAGMATAGAQTPEISAKPYASIASRGTSYLGPGREAASDLAGSTIRLGFLAPLHGPRKAEGDAIVAAARLALEDANPLHEGRRLELALGDESGPSWGHTSDELIRLALDRQAVAVITSANGSTAHLSEQVGNRMGIPILTLSTDKTTTQIDIPWIFRLGPSDEEQARIIAEDIYHTRNMHRVLLVAESDHDGRLGGKEFQEVARQLSAPRVNSLSLDPLQPDADSLIATIHKESPEAIVFWTRPEIACQLIKRIWEERIQTPIFLSQEAAQASQGLRFALPDAMNGDVQQRGSIWTVASAGAGSPLGKSFARRYELLTGSIPSQVAAEAYDAVRLVARALCDAGPNRARLRDQIASVHNDQGVSGLISFDQEGNNRTRIRLVRMTAEGSPLATRF
ncbi:MAG TPA: ABC transporter substrate-binding protein [Terriglobia bacterium]|nr:ABC transporter substrate-binding protein [Terriglobia bacterium]